MKISTNWEIDTQDLIQMSSGYPHAHAKIIETFRKHGVKIKANDLSAPVKLSFCSPIYHTKHEDQYTIGYSSHESSKLPDHWAKQYKKMDEAWSPSTFGINVFKNYVGDKATTVFPHGVSEKYSPIKRNNDGVFTFLHVGEPYQRKMGKLVAQAFEIAFKDRGDVQLIFKTNGSEIHGLPKHTISTNASNIIIMSEFLTLQQYIDLLNNSNCLVFPSIGEGFGMINLEALATGLPIISTWEWAEYQDYIINRVDSTISPAPREIVGHVFESQLQGDVFLPSLDSVVENMINVYENYKWQAEIHYENSFKIHEEYSWDNVVTKYAIPRLENIIKSL